MDIKNIKSVDELIKALNYININSDQFSDGLHWVFDNKKEEIKIIRSACVDFLSKRLQYVDEDNVKKLRDAGYIVRPAGKILRDGIITESRGIGCIRKNETWSVSLLYKLSDHRYLVKRKAIDVTSN